MTDAIRVENLGKRYRVAHAGDQQARYRTLRDSLGEFASARRWLGREGRPARRAEEFWALRDVSFKVQPGEVVGILGHNGSGKSTLLKILSRITRPTTGRAVYRGRVGSLLEVGTGFHPELSGRENVFLNGSILGISRREIARKFDEIVAFAGVDPFIDMPVKRYSSGMYVRLAFAVAAHLESEILIVDEVLAVGDAEFQRKCLGRMQEIGRDGRAILFVSHDLNTLQNICKRGILLRRGTIVEDGEINRVTSHLLRDVQNAASQDISERGDCCGVGQAKLSYVQVTGGSRMATLFAGGPARFFFQLNDAQRRTDCAFTIHDQHGQPVAAFDTRGKSRDDRRARPLEREYACDVEELLLPPGRYYVNVEIFRGDILHDRVEGATFFDVESGEFRSHQTPTTNQMTTVPIRHTWSSKN